VRRNAKSAKEKRIFAITAIFDGQLKGGKIYETAPPAAILKPAVVRTATSATGVFPGAFS
jgi:hypothetical protein